MKRLVAIGLMASLICTSAAWAQSILTTSPIALEDPNEPNEPPVEWTVLLTPEDDPNEPTELTWMALEEDPNEPNEPPVEWSVPVAAEDDPNEPNEPPVE